MGRRRATTVEDRENQLISAAVKLAEQQLKDGTASSQVITHFLKLGSTREKMEREKMELENELLKARKESLDAETRVEELYQNAIKAVRRYQGNYHEHA